MIIALPHGKCPILDRSKHIPAIPTFVQYHQFKSYTFGVSTIGATLYATCPYIARRVCSRAAWGKAMFEVKAWSEEFSI